jgi:hypothetical protein
MKIIIETIPHNKQRYPTVGDWFLEGEVLHIKVSKLSNWRREALVAVHELVETILCSHDGVTQEEVDKFDKAFEAARTPGNVEEPGDDPSAPYRKQHGIATGIERILAAALDVNWKDYEEELDLL